MTDVRSQQEMSSIAQTVDRPATEPAKARTRPFHWSVRRELWENRSLYIAPLIVAAGSNFPAVATALIAAGAKVNAANGLGLTPLLAAAKAGNLDVLTVLVAAGADVNAADANGQTALAAATQFGRSAVRDALIAAGAAR